ncbi:MAG: LacI family DNA-binding transcriptional regulator [Desulfobacterales bacterium]
MVKPNMADIARLSGVSLATVSRAIHAPHKVRDETRKKVLGAIREHNYIYNAAAADLSRRQSKVIGLLIPTTRSPVFAESILAIQEYSQSAGYAVILGNTSYNAATEKRLLQQFEERRVAGVILTGFTFACEADVAGLKVHGIPHVIIWEDLNDRDINFVGFDNFRTAQQMTEHLISFGHRRIGLIIGPYSKVGRVRKRWEGFKHSMEKNGLAVDPALVVETEPTLENGEAAMSFLLGRPEPPTAVFAASDVLAIGALKAARQAGLAVPEQISVAGHDDIGFAAYTQPPLTTMRVRSYEIGRLAVEVLLEEIDTGKCRPRRHCLAAELVVRGSCGSNKLFAKSTTLG